MAYQLLFAANRAQRDIQMAVFFLTTRVQKPNEDDWAKLMQVLPYLNGTRHLKLILSADAINLLYTGTLMHRTKSMKIVGDRLDV
jgi:hypothetical protein